MSAEMIEEQEPVQPEEDMDTELFALHMEHRHTDSLVGMIPLWFSSDYVEQCYRIFHGTIHRLRPSHLTHYHGD